MAAILYASLNEYYVRRRVKTEVSSLTNEDTQSMLRALRAASRRVDRFCGRSFYPWYGTQSFDYENAREIRFGTHDLLEIDTVTTAGGDTSVAAADYDLLTGDVYGLYPKSRLLIHSDAGTLLTIGDRYEQSNAVTGWWGYHEDWGNAFLSSLDTVEDDPLSAAATSLTVNNADGADENGSMPRFQIGQLLKIESDPSEYVYVSAVNTTTNVLTIARAQSGTTAAAHVQNTAITVYQPMEDVKEAALIIASYLLNLPDAPYGTVQVHEGTYQMRLTIPETAVELLMPFKDARIGTKKTAMVSGTGRLYPGGVDPWRGR